jgi:uncharacterized protein with HEPN domain
MSKDWLRIPDYLERIVQAVQRIRSYAQDMDHAAFLQDERTQDAVIRNIEIMGEAARNITQADAQFAARHADTPWQDIYLMRNRVSHGYFSVDLDIIWKVVQRDIIR